MSDKFMQGVDEWMKEASLPEEFHEEFRELVKKAAVGDDLRELLDPHGRSDLEALLSYLVLGGCGAALGGGLGYLKPYMTGAKPAEDWKRWLPVILGALGGGGTGILGAYQNQHY